MDLLAGEVWIKFARKNPATRKWLSTWAATVKASQWASLIDLRKAYPSADGVVLKSGTVVTVFNVKKNSYRLLALVSYELGAVQVLEVLTHADYDKNKWKKWY